MSRKLFFASVNCLLLAGAAIVPAPAVAQPNTETSATHEQARLPIEVVSVDYPVSYADLDLSRTADAATFEKRINDAAKEACSQLTKKYPPEAFMPTPTNQDCVGTATRQAMVVAKQVIAAASKK